MAAPSGADRFAAGKAVMLTAERDPARVYPHFDGVAALLAGEGKIVRWNAMQILAAMAAVDEEHKLDGVLDAYLTFTCGPNLVTAANAIQGAGRIAAARPDLKDRIVSDLLGVENATYGTAECRNVAIGQVLTVLAALGPDVCCRPDVSDFVRRQQSNPRPAVAKQAKRMVANLDGA